MIDSEFNRIVRRIKFNLSDVENLLTMAAKMGCRCI